MAKEYLDKEGLRSLIELLRAELAKIDPSDCVESGQGKCSIQQSADGVESGFSFENKNPNAARFDNNVSKWNEGIEYVPYGAGGDYATALGGKSYAMGKRSTAIGTTTIAIGNYSFASGDNTVAIGADSHTEGYKTTAVGKESHAEGFDTIAKGRTSHSEGNTTVAEGEGSHAEGTQTHAEGNFSHAEGNSTVSPGMYSHTEGEHTNASGRGSHAGGYFTVAHYDHQTVVGEYNICKTDTLLEVGNGTSESNRQNAFEVCKDGRARVYGKPKESCDVLRLEDLDDVAEEWVFTLDDGTEVKKKVLVK